MANRHKVPSSPSVARFLFGTAGLLLALATLIALHALGFATLALVYALDPHPFLELLRTYVPICVKRSGHNAMVQAALVPNQVNLSGFNREVRVTQEIYYMLHRKAIDV
eukprot:SAG11_NODE_16366_length_549_cov_1.706667_1_plen_109_part_00